MSQGAAIRFIPGEKGIIRNIFVPAELEKSQGVEEIVLYKKPGDYVDGTKSSNDRVGHVIATGKDAEEAFLRAADIVNKIKVEYS